MLSFMLNTPDKTPLYSLIAVLLAMILASIHPLAWSSYLLHQAGTLIFMSALLLGYRYLPIRRVSLILATVFVIIHIIGARYLYSFVPYDVWSMAVFDISISEAFGWERNMYDRLVHLSYGFLLFGFMYDMFCALYKHSTYYQLLFLVLMFNLASSALYELFEWGLAMTMSPEAAEAYNGQQGDMWDAHKDMALALLGAVLFIPFNLKAKLI